MRGNKPNPAAQAARGNPGKRTKRVEAALARGHELAERLAAETADHDPLALPFFFDDRFPLAAQVWRKFAPDLQDLNLLRPTHRLLFAGFCVFYAQWVHASENVAGNEIVRVKGTNGAYREKMSPWLDLQRTAWAEVVRLSDEFGLSPAAGYSLMRDQAAALGGRASDLFGPGAPREPAAAAKPANLPADKPAPVAADMAAFDSQPPADRLN